MIYDDDYSYTSAIYFDDTIVYIQHLFTQGDWSKVTIV